MLIPATARPWLAPAGRDRTWPSHGAMMVRRREALAALLPAYAAWPRLGIAALAWLLGVGGAVLVGRGMAEESWAYSAGIGLSVLATVLGGVVVATGSALARAVADWWTLATGVRADGGRVDALPDPDTLRAHREAVDTDRAQGAGQLWRAPLLPRTAAAALLTVAAAVLTIQCVAGYAEIATPFAGPDVRGPWLARALIAVICLLTAALTASGLRRIHRARMHRVAHRPLEATQRGPAPAPTQALGTGAIVVGGQQPTGPPPEWADTFVGAVDGGLSGAGGGAAAPPPTDPPSAPPPAPPTDPAAPRVRLGDGRELGPGTTLIGRDPRPRPGEHADAVLAVADGQVSRTHLTVQIQAGRAVVVDRGSTNGTVLHRGARALPLTPDQEQALQDADTVVLGATTLTVGETPEVEHTVLRPPTGG